MDDQEEISTRNRVVTTNRICKACTIELYDRKIEADLFILDTGGYSVISDMTWLSKYHVVIDYRNKKVIFRISHQPEFQFIGERKSLRKEDQLDCATAKDKKKGCQYGMNSWMYLRRYQDFHLIELWNSLLTLLC